MQSIVAAFPNSQTAQRAVDSLVQQGIDRASIHLQSAEPAAPVAAGGTSPGDPFGFLRLFSGVFQANAAEAGKYAEAVRRGNTVVVLDVEDAAIEQATRLIEALGPIDIDQRAARWQSQGWSGFDVEAAPLSEQERAAEHEESVVPGVQEELQVGKHAVQGGGVRVVKRVTETPVTETVTLREERATLERRPVDRLAMEGELSSFEEGTIEVREVSEQAIVGKIARVVEEVVVGKAVTERAEQVSETLRRTDVEVERVGAFDTTADRR